MELRINFETTTLPQRIALHSFLYLVLKKDYPGSKDLQVTSEMVSSLSTALLTLNSQEDEVLRRRYGLIDGIPCSIEDVAIKMGLSRREATILQTSGLRKMQSPLVLMQLKKLIS